MIKILKIIIMYFILNIKHFRTRIICQIIYFYSISKLIANIFEETIQNVKGWYFLFALLLYNRHLLSSWAKYNNKQENLLRNSNVFRKKKLNLWRFVSREWPTEEIKTMVKWGSTRASPGSTMMDIKFGAIAR